MQKSKRYNTSGISFITKQFYYVTFTMLENIFEKILHFIEIDLQNMRYIKQADWSDVLNFSSVFTPVTLKGRSDKIVTKAVCLSDCQHETYS